MHYHACSLNVPDGFEKVSLTELCTYLTNLSASLRSSNAASRIRTHALTVVFIRISMRSRVLKDTYMHLENMSNKTLGRVKNCGRVSKNLSDAACALCVSLSKYG